MRPSTVTPSLTEAEQAGKYKLLLVSSWPKERFSLEQIKTLLNQGVYPYNPKVLQELNQDSIAFSFLVNIIYSPDETTAIHLFRFIHQQYPNLLKEAIESPPLLYQVLHIRRFRLAEVLLTELDYPVDKQDEAGKTTLYHFANSKVAEGILDDRIRFLLAHNADPCKLTPEGHTPVSDAALESIRQILLESPKAAHFRALYPKKTACLPKLSLASVFSFFRSHVMGYQSVPQEEKYEATSRPKPRMD